ncbi:MAG TPA: UrcA family protein [Rhizomicrobium sp.]|nr:UrcA family protein [Rhizomicrobium sp.]
MPNTHQMRTALLLAAAGACLATSSARAQAYSGAPNESVIVEAPRLRAETTPLNGPPGRAWLSMNVRYDDLNLLTRSGARALRWRVWRTANQVCDRLADAYPVYQLSTAEPCVREAYENAMVQAYGAISNARVSYRLGY